jgi:hypothetical protein
LKKVFVVLGVVFAALIVIFAGLFGIAAYKGLKLDASCVAYVNANLPPILGTWSEEELIQRAAPQLLKAAPDAQMSLLFAKLKQLGPLEEYEGATGSSNVSMTTQAGKVVSGNYTAKAKFEQGDATINVRLVQIAGEWKIVGFHVDSPFFLK